MAFDEKWLFSYTQKPFDQFFSPFLGFLDWKKIIWSSFVFDDLEFLGCIMSFLILMKDYLSSILV